MGGQAFATHSPPLSTPRMPPKIYNLMLSQTLELLQKHFTYAASPIEAPGKESYGDIDILVSGPLSPTLDFNHTSQTEVASNLQTLLRAKGFIAGKPTINLAVPWPGVASDDTTRQEEKYVQIDVHHLPTPGEFRWELFHSAHGDLWNILGTTIRPYGLTANNFGLYVRIPEIELLDRRKSLVFLTSDPRRVLEFLGLDYETWCRPFESREQMYEYAASSRLFWVKAATEGGEVEGDVVGVIAEGENSGLGKVAGQDGEGQVEGNKKKLKHNDRQRMAKRVDFRQWIEEFIPQCRRENRYTSCSYTRDGVREMAFEDFGVRDEYESRLHEWVCLRHKEAIIQAIKSNVPRFISSSQPEVQQPLDNQFRAASIKTLREIILEGKVVPGLPVPDDVTTGETGCSKLEAVVGFVVKEWKAAGEIGWELQKQRGIQIQREKAAKEATGEL